jgi:hypothetical protein
MFDYSECMPQLFGVAKLKRLLPPGTYDNIMSGVGLKPENPTFYALVVDRLVQTALNTSRPQSRHRRYVGNVIDSTQQRFPTAVKFKFAFHVSTGPIHNLDYLMKSRNRVVDVGRIASIKVDVEGMEADVLSGGRETILRDFPFLMLEGGNHDPRVASVLDELGYRVAERTGEPLVPTSGKSSQVNGFFFHERHVAAYRAKGLLVDP